VQSAPDASGHVGEATLDLMDEMLPPDIAMEDQDDEEEGGI
jgi:hypothetical protein